MAPYSPKHPNPIAKAVLCKALMTVYICMLVCCQSAPIVITSTIAARSRGFTHIVPLAGTGSNPTDIAQIMFEVTAGPDLTTTSLYANFDSPVTHTSIDLEDFYHKDPRNATNYDLDAMWEARDQYINIPRTSTSTSLTLAVFNFDPSYRAFDVTYRITVNFVVPSDGFLCESCLNTGGGGSIGDKCVCRSCKFQYTGKICSRQIIKLTANFNESITPGVFNYFRIENTTRITVEISADGGSGETYFQFEEFDGEVASFYNVAQGQSADGRYIVNSNVKKIIADTQGRVLLITAVNFENKNIRLQLIWYQDSQVSVLVIVMSVLGGILLIALIVAIVCIIKRRNAASLNRISSQLNLPTQNNKLSVEEIHRFFPECPYSELGGSLTNNSFIGAPDTTISQMNKAPQKEQTASSTDCVICLEQINETDLIRIGYCRHVLHSVCLLGWFKKQRNCPYCRKDYNREETVAEYNKLMMEWGNRVLEGTDLCKAIYCQKITSKTFIENMD